MLGALGTHGLQAVMTADDATDTEAFRTHVKRVLGLVPDNIVVMDSLLQDGGYRVSAAPAAAL